MKTADLLEANWADHSKAADEIATDDELLAKARADLAEWIEHATGIKPHKNKDGSYTLTADELFYRYSGDDVEYDGAVGYQAATLAVFAIHTLAKRLHLRVRAPVVHEYEWSTGEDTTFDLTF